MPLYEVRNKNTGEIWEEFLSISAMEDYLRDNPDVERVISAPNIIGGIAGVTHKNDSGFNDMMSRIAAANPTSPLAEKYGDKGVKASKTREAVKNQKIRQITRS
jgi:hypothetical protein